MGYRRHGFLLVSVLVISLQALVLMQAAQQNRALIISGHSGQLTVVEISGRSYVEVEALARLTNGSLDIQANRMVLTLPGSQNSTPAPEVSQPVASGFSQEFLKAGIETMSDVREWRSALTNAIQRGYRVTPDWVDNLRNRAQQNLAFASVASSTGSDIAAFQLLTNEFNNMKQLSDRFLQASKSLTYIPTDSLDNDPLDQKILKCARALAAMAASGHFTDDGSCH